MQKELKDKELSNDADVESLSRRKRLKTTTDIIEGEVKKDYGYHRGTTGRGGAKNPKFYSMVKYNVRFSFVFVDVILRLGRWFATVHWWRIRVSKHTGRPWLLRKSSKYRVKGRFCVCSTAFSWSIAVAKCTSKTSNTLSGRCAMRWKCRRWTTLRFRECRRVRSLRAAVFPSVPCAPPRCGDWGAWVILYSSFFLNCTVSNWGQYYWFIIKFWIGDFCGKYGDFIGSPSSNFCCMSTILVCKVQNFIFQSSTVFTR